MPNNQLPTADDILYGITAVLQAQQLPVGSDISIKIAHSPEDDFITGTNFRFLVLAYPSQLDHCTTHHIPFPHSHLLSLQLLLNSAFFPANPHHNFTNIPAWTRQCNIRPCALNAVNSKIIAFLAIPPETLLGHRFDVPALQHTAFQAYEELRLKLQQIHQKPILPSPSKFQLSTLLSCSAYPLPNNTPSKKRKTLARDFTIALHVADTPEGHHLANTILSHSVDPDTKSFHRFINLIPGNFSIPFIPYPKKTTELKDIFDHIQTHMQDFRRTYRPVSVPHLSRFIVDAPQDLQQNYFVTKYDAIAL
eukprot:scaffold134571_cov23-Cyclotella_meneghiniana.AAC.1